jgi:hypothetical protein
MTIRVDSRHAEGEAQVAELLAPRLRALGFEVEIIQTPTPGKAHLVARLRAANPTGQGRPRLLGITTIDKNSLSVTVRTRGTSTHSSRPLPDSAIRRLVRALFRIDRFNTRPRITPTARRYLRAWANAFDVSPTRGARSCASGSPTSCATAATASSSTAWCATSTCRRAIGDRRVTIEPIYGVYPYPISRACARARRQGRAQWPGVRGNDARVPISGLEQGTAWITNMLREVAAAQ